MSSEFILFIPARAGSKGLPGKNMRALGGKPLVQHTLEVALSIREGLTFLSSDDGSVRVLAKHLGVNTTYERPAELASDTASMADTVAHGLEWLAKQGALPEFLVLLQPTSPFRTAEDVRESVRLLRGSEAPGVVGVSAMWTPPHDCVEEGADGKWRFLVENDCQPKRRQELKQSYWFINGAIYTLRTENFLRDRQFLYPDSLLLKMREENTVDIDLPRDLLIAEALLRARHP